MAGKLILLAMFFMLPWCVSAQEPVYRLLVKMRGAGGRATNGREALALPHPAAVALLYPEATHRTARGSSAHGVHYLIETPWRGGMDSLLHYLALQPGVEYAEADAIGRHASVLSRQEPFFPDDTFFGRQWSLHNDGSFTVRPIKPDADADLPEAWAITQGSPNVTVAILDSGIKPDHPEFAGRIWVNTREVPGNGADDDGNGFTDDVSGWNMTQDNADVQDTKGHGTHVAGIIGATGNNSLGYAGVDWHCKLMICKVLGDDLTGYYSWWARAIHYAVDNGAHIINMSLGGTEYSKTLEDAVNYAREKNVLIVASMQNYGSDEIYYPAGYAPVVAVGATDPDDRRSLSFAGTGFGSNYGDHLDIVAPGNYIYGVSHRSNNDYNFMLSGTSQAAPLVSGIAALVLATNGTLTVEELENRLLSSAEDGVGDPSEDAPGWDRYYGFGRINAYFALSPQPGWQRPFSGRPVVYPNPSAGSLTVAFDQGEILPYTISLIDTKGQTIKTAQAQTSRVIDQTFSLFDIPSGLYVVEIRTSKYLRHLRWIKRTE